LPALAAAPVIAFAGGASAHGVHAGLVAGGLSLLGAFVCAFVPFLWFAKGAVGGGDVKLLAAIGALLGPRLGIDAEFYGFLFGALYVPAKLAWQGVLFQTLAGALNAAANPFRPKSKRAAVPAALKMHIRLGPAIAAGTLSAVGLSWMGA
jgi:prepilin peptidase CpaA